MQNLSALQALTVSGRITARVGPAGIVYLDLVAPGGEASLCLQGAHLTRFQPRGQSRPLIWLSDAARYAVGGSIRGGVPVCWPWFGAHATRADWPAHGYARTAAWELVDASADAATSRVRLRLAEDARTRAMWPHATPVELSIAVSDALEMELSTRNDGPDAVELGEALHTYFEVGDIAQVRLRGLDGCDYLDKPRDFGRFTQTGAVDFVGETDRVYLDTRADCLIDDPVLGRRIVVAKRGSATTVVWTPWQERAAAMGDFTPDGWRRMLCVESANAHANRLTLAPGASHTLAVRYRVETLSAGQDGGA